MGTLVCAVAATGSISKGARIAESCPTFDTIYLISREHATVDDLGTTRRLAHCVIICLLRPHWATTLTSFVVCLRLVRETNRGSCFRAWGAFMCFRICTVSGGYCIRIRNLFSWKSLPHAASTPPLPLIVRNLGLSWGKIGIDKFRQQHHSSRVFWHIAVFQLRSSQRTQKPANDAFCRVHACSIADNAACQLLARQADIFHRAAQTVWHHRLHRPVFKPLTITFIFLHCCNCNSVCTAARTCFFAAKTSNSSTNGAIVAKVTDAVSLEDSMFGWCWL